MGLSSLRVRALGVVERTLRRWLGFVEDQLEPADVPPTLPAREPFVSRQLAPPDHWVELVRQSAPQLLDSDDTSDDGTVIDYRAPDAPPTFPSSLPPVRPPSFAPVTPLRPPVNPTVSATSSAKRPLRLEPVRTQVIKADSLTSHSAEVAGEVVTPPTITTKAPSFEPSRGSLTQADAVPVLPPTHRTDSAANPPQIPLRTRYRSLEANSVREVSTSSGENESIAPHFADLPAEPSLNFASTNMPQRTDIPVVRTRAARETVSLNQPRTSVPTASPQVTMHPTTVPPSLNIEDVQPERWPSLPEMPDEVAPYTDNDRQRRERLLHEQEGRSWSE